MFPTEYFPTSFFPQEYFPSIASSGSLIAVLSQSLSTPSLAASGSLLLIGILSAQLLTPSISFRGSLPIPDSNTTGPIFVKGKLVVGKRLADGAAAVFHHRFGVGIRNRKAQNRY